MELIELLIHSFRGIESQTIEANGSNVNIYGRNGAGKTTTADAFLWLLFGKDSADKKDFDLIPHKLGLTEPDIGQGKEPTVEAKLEYFGKTVTLKKSYLEEWPKKGEFKGQYTGSKTHFFVDELEVKAGEYQAIVSELVDDKLFKLITNPQYFIALPWQERRETLIKIAGELDVAINPELEKLMNGRKFEEFYLLSKQKSKEKQKQIDGMPFAITATKNLIPEISGDEESLKKKIGALKVKQATLEYDLNGLKNDDSANARRRDIAFIETEISEARNKYNSELDVLNSKYKAAIERLETEQRGKESNLYTHNNEIQKIKDDVDRLSSQKSLKLKEYHDVDDLVWAESDICPTCGQAFPAEHFEAAKAAFNVKRSEDLERLVSEGKALKNSIESKETELNVFVENRDKLSVDIEVLKGRIEKGKAMIKTSDFESSDEYISLTKKRNELDEAPLDSSQSEKIVKIQTELSDIQTEIEENTRIKIQLEEKAKLEVQLAELMSQQETLNAELGQFEKAVDLCKQHDKAKAKALETAVNDKFKIARFRMFQMQKNGDEAECCDVIYPNGSTNLSTGERLQTGIDIINTLTDYYGVTAPVWVDNFEGVTLPIESTSQLINMIVDKNTEKLKVEVLV